MNQAVLIALAVLHLIAVGDIWGSRLTLPARILWTLTVLFLPPVGLVA